MMFFLLIACAFHTTVTGLVDYKTDRERVALYGPDGIEYTITPSLSKYTTVHSSTLGSLEGLGISVTGSRIGPYIFVRRWHIVDGGDGSVPFVGVLRRHGSQFLLADRYSGGDYILDFSGQVSFRPVSGDTNKQVDEFIGLDVVVVGFIIGPHQVRVVEIRSIGPVD